MTVAEQTGAHPALPFLRARDFLPSLLIETHVQLCPLQLAIQIPPRQTLRVSWPGKQTLRWYEKRESSLWSAVSPCLWEREGGRTGKGILKILKTMQHSKTQPQTESWHAGCSFECIKCSRGDKPLYPPLPPALCCRLPSRSRCKHGQYSSFNWEKVQRATQQRLTIL